MKFTKETIASSGKTAYWLATNFEELVLIHGLLKRANRYFPENFEYEQDRHRLNNIIRTLGKTIGRH